MVAVKNSVVLITIRERESDLLELLSHLLQQKAKPQEVIVLCEAGIQIPSQLSTRYRKCGIGIRFIEVMLEVPLGSSRNTGIRCTKGEYVYFLDDDAIPADSWLYELEKSLDSGADVAGGVTKPRFLLKRRIESWWDEALLGGYIAVGNEYAKFTNNSIWGCNFAVKKDVTEKIGYFDESLGLRRFGPQVLGEDIDFILRAAKRRLDVRVNAQAIVYHTIDECKLNLSYLKERALANGRTMKIIARKHNSNSIFAFFRSLFSKICYGFYVVLLRGSNVMALPVYLKMLLYHVVGWLDPRV
ncbi:MAG: glycosyltransferase [Desulfobacterales bacterium]|nr:glycosyltransferase [Desulfobacterales bacterium]